MPRRTDIETILIIGPGPIIIGQACEFDYSSTQACKALKDEGYRVVLLNSNPATIMTDPEVADVTYIEPITPEVLEKIIQIEKPQALLPTMGGQTALNTALAASNMGILEKHGVELIGANADSIEKAEDRQLFSDAMKKIGLETPRARVVSDIASAAEALEYLGLPLVIRPSFTLAGTGGGIVFNRDEFYSMVESGLSASPVNQVLLEESVLGWKEFEMEVVRDKKDNCIIICSIENIDPMGVHTGDSVTVAPALTLTDKEYQIMRTASFAVLREIGVETGGSNVQFAINPENGRMVVIEMNPRVSRSSALASKATGFPIAKVAARLAVGYTLDELDNDITGGLFPASFEPTIDYIVTKMPRFAFEKFPGSQEELTTSMRSVGEAMGIGRTFAESLQKVLVSMEVGLAGLDEVEFSEVRGNEDDKNVIRTELSKRTPGKILRIAQALRFGISVEEINRITSYDPWFIQQIKQLVDIEQAIIEGKIPLDAFGLSYIKSKGFSDERVAKLTGKSANEIRNIRNQLGINAVYKRVDTCGGEFASTTPYLYSTFESPYHQNLSNCEAEPSDKKKILILGGGPNRIGQGIEFDYCCCHAAYSLAEAGYETIMINCNPETVSTDFDTSHRLYFEPLTTEHITSIADVEGKNGTIVGAIVQFGGQTPLKLAKALDEAGIKILGTPSDSIDLAEDRERFKELLERLELKQPPNGIAFSTNQAEDIAEKIGYPVILRPSYVLGGRAMEIVYDKPALQKYINTAVDVSGTSPVLVDSYISDAIEVDVDALGDGEDIVVCGIMEHIEQAGIHSGDSACSMPTRSLSLKIQNNIIDQTIKLGKSLKVKGLMNIQFAVKDDDIYVLEVNPRASRTVPFVAKVIGMPIAGIAARLSVGEKISNFNIPSPLDIKDPDCVKDSDNDSSNNRFIAVKESVFPFARFPGVDSILGPEMRSTGEVMGIDSNFPMAFAKAQISAGSVLPTSGSAFFSVREEDKAEILPLAKKLQDLGFSLFATSGTARFLIDHNLAVKQINKVLEGQPNVVDALCNGQIDIVFNTSGGATSIRDSRSLREAAIMNRIPSFTTVAAAAAAVAAIEALTKNDIQVRSLQSYHSKN